MTGPLSLALALALLFTAAPAVRADTPQADGAESAAAHAKKNKKKKKRKRARAGFRLETRARAGGGYLHGYRERRLDAALAELGLHVEPSWSSAGLQLALPLDIAHRQTFGEPLRETRLGGAVEARYRIARELRLSAAAGARAKLRPDWPDSYQPSGSRLLRTDRYTYGERFAQLGVTVHPGRHHWLRGSYQYSLLDYVTDPAFEAVARPNHLTPFDQDEHGGELGYRFATRHWKAGVSVAGALKQYFFVFARDAHTGFTHAGPGGPPANPLRELRQLEPALELQLEPAHSGFELDLRYAHELQDDPFQGYESYSGPNPSLELSLTALRPLTVRAGAELWWRRYGADSYRQGIGHPPLDSGDRRHDHRVEARLGAELALDRHLTLDLEARYLVRSTNFPDYVPGEFPASQRYAIDWDYRNVAITLGLEWRARWL